jgi:hypothetical protein
MGTGIKSILVNFEVLLILSDVDAGRVPELPQTSVGISKSGLDEAEAFERGQNFFGNEERVVITQLENLALHRREFCHLIQLISKPKLEMCPIYKRFFDETPIYVVIRSISKKTIGPITRRYFEFLETIFLLFHFFFVSHRRDKQNILLCFLYNPDLLDFSTTIIWYQTVLLILIKKHPRKAMKLL